MSRTNLSITAIIALVFVPAQILAWTGPTDTAPGDNTEAPLNISGTAQAKSAGLLLNTGGATNGLLVQYGNVGFGTVSPGAKLHLSKEVAGADFLGLFVENSDATGDSTARVGYNANLSSDFTQSADGRLYIDSRYNDVASGIVFRVKASGTPIEGMRITSTGNVGIGTAAPGYKLQVGGSVGAASFYYTSDKNLKKDIKPLENSLLKILNLQGVSFSWKDTSEKRVGLIAQDVEQVYPELVSTNPESGIKSVEYGSLVAPLIEAIKAQQKEIESLKREVESLKK